METQQPPYIVPIITPKNHSYEFAGTGFIVDHYLITAAHVVAYWAGFGLAAIVQGKGIELDFLSQKMNVGPSNNKNSLDFAVFDISSVEIQSPLSLADEEPPYDKNKDVIMTSKHFQPQGDGDAFYRECECLVTCQSPNFNHCFEGFNFSKTIGGSSGSPLILGDIVYGMVIMGQSIQGDIQQFKEMAEKAGIPCTQEDIEHLSHNLTFLKASEIKKRMIEEGLL